jgi:hypothetical protein
MWQPANIGFYNQKHAINEMLEPMEAKNNQGIKLMLWQKEITIHSDKMNAIKFEDNEQNNTLVLKCVLACSILDFYYAKITNFMHVMKTHFVKLIN